MAAETSPLNSFLMHVLIVIPLEFGLLHSTPLGPWLTDTFHHIWEGLGFDFPVHDHGAGAVATAFNPAASGTEVAQAGVDFSAGSHDHAGHDHSSHAHPEPGH